MWKLISFVIASKKMHCKNQKAFFEYNLYTKNRPDIMSGLSIMQYCLFKTISRLTVRQQLVNRNDFFFIVRNNILYIYLYVSININLSRFQNPIFYNYLYLLIFLDSTGGLTVKYNFEEGLDVDLDNSDTYILGLRYEEFIAPLIQVVQNQQKQIQDLEKKIAILSN